MKIINYKLIIAYFVSLSIFFTFFFSNVPDARKNAVLIAESDWQAIEESLCLNSIPGMVDSILSGGKTALKDCLGEDEVSFDV